MFEYLFLSQRKGLDWSKEIKLKVKEGKLVYKMSSVDIDHPAENKVQVTYEHDLDSMLKRIQALDIASWKEKYDSEKANGATWYLEYKDSEKDLKMVSGCDQYPMNFGELISLLDEIAEN